MARQFVDNPSYNKGVACDANSRRRGVLFGTVE